MKHFFTILTIIGLAMTISFGQDDEFDSSDDFNSTDEAGEMDDVSSPDESTSSNSFSSADDNEWFGFDHNEAGISGPEFEMVKEKGMTRAELEKLLEIGIMPYTYFSEPWKKLGVSKSEWLTSKEEGMDDDDIDTRVYTQQSFNYEPIITFFLPGYYQYQNDKLIFGASLTTAAVGGIVLAIFLPETTESGTNSEPTEKINPFFPLITLVAMAVSAGDAYIGTRYHNNKRAARFAFNLLPSLDSPQASFSFNF